jgi:hypothetical protein
LTIGLVFLFTLHLLTIEDCYFHVLCWINEMDEFGGLEMHTCIGPHRLCHGTRDTLLYVDFGYGRPLRSLHLGTGLLLFELCLLDYTTIVYLWLDPIWSLHACDCSHLSTNFS